MTIAAMNQLGLSDGSPSELVAEKTGCTLQHARDVLFHLENFAVFSLNRPISDEDGSYWINTLPTTTDFTGINAEEFIASCNAREQFIIRRRLQGQSQKSIAAELGVSQSYVSRIVKRIAKRLVQYMENGGEHGRA
jgi:DNA-directed RNA polymerase specialized sigma subunit